MSMTCCICQILPAVYQNYRDQWFCWPCADGVTHPAIEAWRERAQAAPLQTVQRQANPGSQP